MKINKRLAESVARLQQRLSGLFRQQDVGIDEPPLRSELFTADQMEQHGKRLASSHSLALGRPPDLLLARLAKNEAVLIDVCQLLTAAVAATQRISPAAEWLLDNFYLIEEQIGIAKRHLPKGYSRELPRLQGGESGGHPRVYDIALETISHGDGRVDTESLCRFVAAYQTVTDMTLGELWAIPIMLRLALIENLRRVGVRISSDWKGRNLAASWAEQMTSTAQNNPTSLILVIADMARSNPVMSSAFVAELARRLQGRGPALALPLTWIEQRLSESGQTIEQLVLAENQQLASDQVSISNCIGSLRGLGAVDWREFVETMSKVEQCLREDPGDVYARMNFSTRDQYRHVIEKIARQTQLPELEVARHAVDLARAQREGGTTDRTSHVGYYLIAQGRSELEKLTGITQSALMSAKSMVAESPLLIYLGAIAVITLTSSAGFLLWWLNSSAPSLMTADVSYWLLGMITLLLLIALSQLAVALTNWFAALLVTPRPLPRMDFSRGIPSASRTLVVVPTMLSGMSSIEDLAEAMEVRFLANRDAGLHFALVTDFLDADQQSLPSDGPLLALMEKRVKELNDKYRDGDDHAWDDIFFLLHRARQWNASESRWMGRERKRGKLADLNALLRGASHGSSDDAFSVVVGDIAVLETVKYVITLDTDTNLPRDSARRIVAAMAHPLNTPHYDVDQGRITAGYGILQPRVAISLPGTNRSQYTRLYGGQPGLDPYTRAVSDIYQDVFGEGSFIGKGIYDVDAFEQALAGRLPDNRILSHDLLEGCYARSGLLSDIQLYENSPASYAADVARRYRWIRGDWQVASWLLRHVPQTPPPQTASEHPLSLLSQWKLIDNLRRSLVPIALFLLLLCGWMLPSLPAAWTLAVLAILVLPAFSACLLDLCRKSGDVMLQHHVVANLQALWRQLAQLAFELACLPYEVYFTLEAIARTHWRIWFARKRLLEWNPSSEVDRAAIARAGNPLLTSYRAMWIAPVTATGLTIYLASTQASMLICAGPILVLWFVAPAIAWWISRPLLQRKADLSTAQNLFLRMQARRIWAFFDRFVAAEDHWLPPDNVQDYRVAAVAHRTSPTNIGMALLANLAAADFGYLPLGRLITRTRNTLQTMAQLERHRGHFYNWYDTESLQPLLPRYISSVDSGNLAGHLLTLRAGLMSLPDAPAISSRLFEGLSDTWAIVAASAEAGDKGTAGPLAELGKQLDIARVDTRGSFTTIATHLRGLTICADRLAERAQHNTDVDDSVAAKAMANLAAHSPENAEHTRTDLEGNDWASVLARECHEAMAELHYLAPWLPMSAAPTGLEEFTEFFATPPLTTRELAHGQPDVCLAIARRLAAPVTPAQAGWLHELQAAVFTSTEYAKGRMQALKTLALEAEALAQMDYSFLLDDSSHLLHIGYNVDDRRADSSHYDLLASEARLACFVAIAQGQLPQESWFALGRLLTSGGSDPVLLSWSGSMFEYLMPLLVMPTYDNTLLDQTYQSAVARQIEYGKQRGLPWGMSESGYNLVDVHLNYQYRAFGVPGLGLKRGLADDLVVAPYASMLALMVAPELACQNLQRLGVAGFSGKYGFYEAIDYTPARQRRGQNHSLVRSFMSHHQGMSLLSLAYLLLDRPMQRRFETDRQFQAVMLLLQERIPRATALFKHTAQASVAGSAFTDNDAPIRIIAAADTRVPEVQLLSNGRYHVMVTNAGGGSSRWKDLAVTRWREDVSCDNFGSFVYVRDVSSGVFWSATHQPTLKRAETYEAVFTEGRAKFCRRDSVSGGAHDGKFETHTEIVVSPEDDIELRRLRITNHSRQRREIEITSYAEVVIGQAAADQSHPAFSNLFVQTEILPTQGAILSTRRPRSLGEPVPWMTHLMAVHDADVGDASYETDRMRFIGRTRSAANPQAMHEDRLSGSEGSVLDPIVAIRHRLTLDPEQTAIIDIVTGMSETREQALALTEKYKDRHLADRVFDLTWTHSQVVLRQINASEGDAQLYSHMAGSVIFANASLRANAAVLVKNRRGQSGLWGYAISGDLPIVLVQIGDEANIELVRQMVQAHVYWRLRGLAVDLVIWNDHHNGYRQRLQEQIIALIAQGIDATALNRPGGIFVRPAEQISAEDRVLLQSVARVVISDARGSLAEQLSQRHAADPRTPRLKPTRGQQPELQSVSLPAAEGLILANNLGGFSADGREYVMRLDADRITPAPWVNVLANATFGTVVSESGMAYTWSENAHEFRLTPWRNDPVCDSSGEAIYLRDEESGHAWSPTPLPMPCAGGYQIRHGFGYSVFTCVAGGIRSELWVYVATDEAVKFSVLKVHNESGRARRLSATGYVEWVLGDVAERSSMHVSTEINASTGAIFARNRYHSDFGHRVAFFDADNMTRNLSGDRTEFIGRNGNLRKPAAMKRLRLSGVVGPALDPCAAIQINFDLDPGRSHEIVFRLGAGRNEQDAVRLVQRFRGSYATQAALDTVRQYWAHSLGAVQVETPDKSLDVLSNGWLLYQTQACRLWARSGYYQSGGAFGFRDQLQDVMALVHSEPALVRKHLLLCASRQFKEGDVQHWWHPPAGNGVRTRCSDDYLWLPLAVCRYVQMTGDWTVVDESAPFLEGRAVNPEEDSYYDLPTQSAEVASLYQHCVRAIEHAMKFGAHGLPLIGSGDWNDGMNLVGIKGRGESVWLGFFLCHVLKEFARIATVHDDAAFAARCREEATRLRQDIEKSAWDGAWYRRAYFDDGTPLGSASNEECRIDSISQSWSVLAGSAGDEQSLKRSRLAMQAVDTKLIRRKLGLVQLLDPPFDQSALNPGYIRGYVPGVRENGGQYTHAAIWAAMAFVALDDSERAWEMLNMINPINHASTDAELSVYRVEPYVLAADVYARVPHLGRGGWTWYTGAAGWMYRLITESLLGLAREGNRLTLRPKLPPAWTTIKIHYRYGATMYHIVVTQSPADASLQGMQLSVDGIALPKDEILLSDDGQQHLVEMRISATVSADRISLG